MKRYEDYKDSGVEWIGSIPIDWSSSKLKFHTFKIIDGAHFTPTYVESEGDAVPFLRVTDLHKNEINKGEVKYIPKVEHLELVKRCAPEKGDLLLSKNGTIGLMKIVDWDWEFSIFVSLCLIKFKDSLLNRFFKYFFESSIVDKQLNESSQTTSVTNLHLEKIKELRFILPPLSEQTQIANYLDYKTAQIDALIEKKERLIALLEEERTALINEVVTGKKVWNGSEWAAPTETKDSGIEWLGEIPLHWKASKVKHEFEICGGGTPSKENPQYWNGDIPWISPKDMKQRVIKDSIDKTNLLGVSESSSKIVRENSLLMVVRSGILQRTIPIGINAIPVALNQDLKAFYSLGGLAIEIFYFFIKGSELHLLEDWSKEGATVESIEMNYLLNFTLPVPPMAEQKMMVEFLESENSRISEISEKLSSQISLLKEYKTALISEVVTGKIDVRDEVIPHQKVAESVL